MESGYHTPVMLKEAVDGLDIRPNGVYVDCTLGGGGHSREILGRLSAGGHLFSFDQDEEALRQVVTDNPQWTLVRSNFRYLRNWMRYYGVDAVDGILADLGVSSHHFDDAGRGFSFRADAPLDMRMNQHGGRTAAALVNTYSERQLTDVLRLYGELSQAHKLAAALVRERAKAPITTTGRLTEVLTPICGRDREKKDLARAFQALRIEVNGEMEALRQMLTDATGLLAEGGRLVVISYHSLEDRMVKNLMRSGNVAGNVETDIFGRMQTPLQALGKPMTPSAEELAQNPRSRSAKMRIGVKRYDTSFKE